MVLKSTMGGELDLFELTLRCFSLRTLNASATSTTSSNWQRFAGQQCTRSNTIRSLNDVFAGISPLTMTKVVPSGRLLLESNSYDRHDHLREEVAECSRKPTAISGDPYLESESSFLKDQELNSE